MGRIYPLADAGTQWFGDKFGSAKFDALLRMVIHATETPGWPDYDGGAVAPNITARLAPGWKSLVYRQHFDALASSRALVNKAGGVETNTADVFQIEIVGTSSRKTSELWQSEGRRPGVHYIETFNPGLDVLNSLADLVTWLHRYCGLPLGVYPAWPDTDLNRSGTIGRMTGAQWEAFHGLCGHLAVPENSHADPGSFPALQLVHLVNARLEPHEKPNGDIMASGALILHVTDQPAGDPDRSMYLWTAAGGVRRIISTTEHGFAKQAGIPQLDITEADLRSFLPAGQHP